MGSINERIEEINARTGTDIHTVGSSQALSSGHHVPNWQVPRSLVNSVARRMKKGNDKEYPVHNWRGGLDDVAFLRDRADHAIDHILDLVNGDNTHDDAQGNADALSWFCAMVNEALRLHPETVAAAFYSEPRGEVLVDVAKVVKVVVPDPLRYFSPCNSVGCGICGGPISEQSK